MRIVIPIHQGQLYPHFGHAPEFAIIDVTNGKISAIDYLTPPPHEPGVLPVWMRELNVDVIISGGMGARAQQLFNQYGIQVIVGAPTMPVEEVISQYLAGTLEIGRNVCDH